MCAMLLLPTGHTGMPGSSSHIYQTNNPSTSNPGVSPSSVVCHSTSQQQIMSSTYICAGCQLPILDKYLFNVLDKCWHSHCIKCVDCKISLLDKCFTRNGYIYCKDDFDKRFGTRCMGCDRSVGKEDLVRRARDKVFHIDCFRCGICHKLLDTGEQLYIVNGSRFICKQDYLNGRQSATTSIASSTPTLMSPSVTQSITVSTSGCGNNISQMAVNAGWSMFAC